MHRPFADQVIWITGASSGLGEALARAFAAQGALLVLSARRLALLEALRSTLPYPERVLVLHLDLDDAQSIPLAAERAMGWHGRVDLLINNAGISQRAFALETSMDAARRVMEVNFFGAVALAMAVVPSMVSRGNGHVVNIGSVAGYVSTPLRSMYAASKHAIRAWSDSLRAELQGTGVAVTVICPGYIATEISKNALLADGSSKGGDDLCVANGLPAEVAAARMLPAIRRRRRECYVGGMEIISIYLQRLFPAFVARILPAQAPK